MKSTITNQQFRDARKALGMTQAQLGKALGCAGNTVWRKERTDGKAITITKGDETALRALCAEQGIAFPTKKKSRKNG